MSECSVISAQHQFLGATDRCGSAMVLNEVQSPIRLTSVTFDLRMFAKNITTIMPKEVTVTCQLWLRTQNNPHKSPNPSPTLQFLRSIIFTAALGSQEQLLVISILCILWNDVGYVEMRDTLLVYEVA